MCFLSIYTLKSIISIGIVSTLIIGIVLLYILVYAFIISSIPVQIQTNYRNIFIGSFLLFSLLMIVSSLGGIYGLIRKINKFLIVYSITIFVYFIAFLLLAIFVIQYPTLLQNNCNDNYYSDNFQLAVENANSTLCKTCQCNFHNQDNYTDIEKQRLRSMGFTNYPAIQNNSLPLNAQNCPSWSNTTYPQTQQLILIENTFRCSGWCDIPSQYNLYYLFTNVNNGIPQSTCVKSLLRFFNKFGLVIQITSFIVAAVILVIFTFIVCLCFHPERDRKYDGLKIFGTSLIIEEQQFIKE